jgi:hypothetical protein
MRTLMYVLPNIFEVIKIEWVTYVTCVENNKKVHKIFDKTKGRRHLADLDIDESFKLKCIGCSARKLIGY